MKMRKHKKNEQVLDLTNNNWKEDKKWMYVPMEIVSRPYKKVVVGVSLLIASISLLIPDFGILAFKVAPEVLKKYG